MDNNQVDKNEQKFKPTDAMVKVLQAFCDMDTAPSISARMDKASVSRTLWYEWIKTPGFMEWWETETTNYMQSYIGELLKIGIMKSPKDFRYWEAMMMKFGKYARKEDITSDGEKLDGIVVKFVDSRDDKGDGGNESITENNTSEPEI